jgi:phosphoglycolate phosphatase
MCLPIPSDEELYSFIGPPLIESFQVFIGLSEQDAKTAIANYREYFSTKGLYENQVYPGIPELFAALKAHDKQIYLATSKPEVFAKKILEHFDLAQYFSGIYGATLDDERSSKTAVLRYALAESGVNDKSQSVMIGDRLHDMLGGRDNTLATIGVTYGFGDETELLAAGANAIAHNPEDILNFI